RRTWAFRQHLGVICVRAGETDSPLSASAGLPLMPNSIHTCTHLNHQSIPIPVGLVGAGGSENGSINERNYKAG
ncbi:MAG TPA: hypothetical protein VGZ89_06930, partial [Xanthobacteraceae bacterium]|nr:hypothetical protein [Xanthobacteraceae bacterium]